MKIRIIRKHPLPLRWNHWINFPLLTIMIWSGLMIYWASPAYFLPAQVLEFLGLRQRLAEGLSWHFAFAFLFILNGVFYLLALLFTGHWRYLVPLAPWIRHHPSSQKYEGIQRTVYAFVFFAGVGSAVTGLAIYKPVQLGFLTELLGGYQAARFEHFLLTVFFVLFFVVHVIQVARAGWNQARAMITGWEKVGTHEDL